MQLMDMSAKPLAAKPRKVGIVGAGILGAAGFYHVQRGGRTINTRFQMDSASSTRAVGA